MTVDDNSLSFDSLPEEIAENAIAQLGTWGFDHTPAEEDPTPPADEGMEEAAPPAPPAAEEEDEDDAPPTPPGGPLWRDDETEPGAVPDVPDTPGPAAQTAPQTDPIAAAVAARAASDPAFAAQLTQLLYPAARPAPDPTPEPQGTALQLPQFSEEDLENPALRALLMISARQQAALQDLRKEFTTTQSQLESEQKRQSGIAADSAVSSFQSEYNLPADLTTRLRTKAANYVHAALAEVGNDPLTGQPNQYSVFREALKMAYWNDDEARRFEWHRQTAARETAHTRKQKLAGIGGNSGSSPTRTPAPIDDSTEDGKHRAMVRMAAEAMGLDPEDY